MCTPACREGPAPAVYGPVPASWWPADPDLLHEDVGITVDGKAFRGRLCVPKSGPPRPLVLVMPNYAGLKQVNADLTHLRPTALQWPHLLDHLNSSTKTRPSSSPSSATSGSPSILNVSPESAVGGGLALLETNDIVRVDLNTRKVDIKLAPEELARRKAAVKPSYPPSQTPWQEIYRSLVGQLETGACLEPSTLYLNIIEERGEAKRALVKVRVCRACAKKLRPRAGGGSDDGSDEDRKKKKKTKRTKKKRRRDASP